MTVAQSIETLANAQAFADADRTHGSLTHVQPTSIEILDSVRDPQTGQTTAWFIFDFVVYHSAQSGSDWYCHHVLGGSATIRDDHIIDFTLVRLREDDVTEFQMEWAPEDERYDHSRVRDADRDTWWPTVLSTRGRAS